jgi:L-seryl-tRNA(Ser) seleniumtransferase
MLHTGLGRAPYADNAVESLSVFNNYSVLQTDLETGKRSNREEKIEAMLRELTGCEAATILNNNAEATMLILNALAKEKEVIISRGQLVEIGGSFRMPDVMEQSGAIMIEIGTTNRTHLKDYNAAVSDNTGAILHVHTSNYRIRGFSGTPSVRELCDSRKKNHPDIPVVDDLGSGGLVHLSKFGLPDEPLIRESIAAGVDLVCFSGDKLICGPQAGIICGKADYIAKIRKNPFARMFRVGKMTLAALETTLLHFINDTYREQIPFYRMLSRTPESLTKDADALEKALKQIKDCKVSIIDDIAYVGSGSAPDHGVYDKVLRIQPEKETAAVLAEKLRLNLPSVFCRLKDNTLLFNMRTLLNQDLRQLEKVLVDLLS